MTPCRRAVAILSDEHTAIIFLPNDINFVPDYKVSSLVVYFPRCM
jgi:hypothetical protein